MSGSLFCLCTGTVLTVLGLIQSWFHTRRLCLVPDLPVPAPVPDQPLPEGWDEGELADCWRELESAQSVTYTRQQVLALLAVQTRQEGLAQMEQDHPADLNRLCFARFLVDSGRLSEEVPAPEEQQPR